MQKILNLSESGDTLCATLTCEIDHHTARVIRETIDKRLFEKHPKNLLLDFSGVRFMDSSGVGLIIGRCTVCESLGSYVKLTGLSGLLLKLVRLSGVEKIKNLTILKDTSQGDWISK